MGSEIPFPEDFAFSGDAYFIGITVGDDEEMDPRKRIGYVPRAINTQYLRGSTVGGNEGDLLVLGSDGRISQDVLDTITTLGAVSSGVWEADPIASQYIEDNLTGKTLNGLQFEEIGGGLSITGTNKALTVTQNTALNQNLRTTDTPTFSGLTTIDLVASSGVIPTLTSTVLTTTNLTTNSLQTNTLSFQAQSQPTDPQAGDTYSDGINLYFYNGSTWDVVNGKVSGIVDPENGGTRN